MDKNYEPEKVEAKWYAEYLSRNAFRGDVRSGGDPYVVVIPPPNVTGILHMGHALNVTIQDILVRWRRMQGRNTVWMPGTDHAGIATQNVVERALKKEGQTRKQLGREAFLERVWTWREDYGGTIIRQLKRLGASCDWDRERFTMDEGLSDAVAEVFVRLYDKGLIYRANYIINWCPRCHTALSDEESEHQDTQGKLYYIRYPVTGGGGAPSYVTVATTRPETLLGDVAVAVHPDDERFRGLAGQSIRLPLLNRELTLIRDPLVDPAFGTGAVKVTPAHDANDFEMGRRHGLTPINVMNGDGTMNAEAGPYQGLDRFECRRRILEDLQAQGLLEKVDDHAHAVGHCYRCDTVVEPRLSPQWFVKMKPLAEPAIDAVKAGRVEFIPGRWTKVYLDWMENIRDWCISRQIWWGHRIPIFYCDGCRHEWAAKGRPERCPRCGRADIRQDEDVLDTWFSSWLWPFSTFGWPKRNDDLSFYYPTHDLVTGSEIIFFWVARMIMAGIEFMGDVPFRHVYIHGTVRDDSGRKMSKSLGNSIDPLTIIDEFSADALRFSLMMITATGQDVFVANDKFEIGRNFGTKLWNAARFMSLHTGVNAIRPDAPGFRRERMSPDDRHLLARLQGAIRDTTAHLEKFRFNDAAHTLYEFVWHEFCDWYVEYAKHVLYGTDPERQAQVLGVMHEVFSTALRLLHPMMPFVTEELWHQMGYGDGRRLLMETPWPEPMSAEAMATWAIDDATVGYVDDKHELIRLARTLRSDYGILPGREIAFDIKPASAEAAARLLADQDSVKALLRAETLRIDPDLEVGKAMPSTVCRLGTVYMPLAGLVDVEAEIRRLGGQLDKVSQDIERTAAKLANQQFVSQAPAAVVDKQRERHADLLETKEKLKRLIGTLSAM